MAPKPKPAPRGTPAQKRNWKNWFANIKKLRWQAVMLVFLLLGSFWAFVTYYTIDSYSNEWQVEHVKVRMFAPMYLSPNEEEEIRFSVENFAPDYAQVAFKLKSDGNLMSFVGSPENNDFYAGRVEKQAQMTRSMKVFVPFDRHHLTQILNMPTGLSLWAGADNGDLKWISDLPISTAPVPKAKAITSYLGALLGALALWMCKELWEEAKPKAGTTPT